MTPPPAVPPPATGQQKPSNQKARAVGKDEFCVGSDSGPGLTGEECEELRSKFQNVQQMAAEQISNARDAAAGCPVQSKLAISARTSWVGAELRYFKAKVFQRAHPADKTAKRTFEQADAELDPASAKANAAMAVLRECSEGK